MSALWCFEFCSARKPVSLRLVEATILLFLAISVIGLTKLLKSKKTRKLKLPSNTSSLVITRFKTQNIKEEPFLGFNPFYQDYHRELDDIGAWADHSGRTETYHVWNHDILPSLGGFHSDLDGTSAATYHQGINNHGNSRVDSGSRTFSL